MRAVKRELLFFALIGVLFLLATGFSSFNTEQNYGGENPDRVAPGRLTLNERLGFAIIANAGYGTIDLIPASDDNGHTPHFRVSDQLKPELDCISNKLGDVVRGAPDGSGMQNLGDPKALVEAILAAEKYNRGPLQRGFESAVAHGALYITGHVPEMSLGLGQVKPSVARAVLPPEELSIMSERELLDYLLDDCSSAYVASTYVATLLAAEPPDRSLADLIADVASQYNGGGNPTYVGVVTAAFRQLTNSTADFSESAENSAAAAGSALRLCAVFETGVPEGRILVPGKDAAVPVDDVVRLALGAAQSASLTMTQWEPGPKSYLARLSQLRRDWTGQTLHGLGLPPDLPIVDAKGNAETVCAVAADYRPQPSLVLITVAVPAESLPPPPPEPDPQ